MGIAFAAAVAGGPGFHQPRVHAVLQVAGEDAILDQHSALRRMAFIVYVEAAAAAVQRAVIQHCYALGRHPLSDAAAKGAAALAVEITLQPVSDGLVDQHTGPSSAQHHVHFTRRRWSRFQIHQRGIDRFIHILLQQNVVKIIQAEAATAATAAGFAAHLAADSLFGDDRKAQPYQRTHIGRQRAIEPRHQHHVVFGGKAGHDLCNTGVLGARHFFDFFQHRHLGCAVKRANGVEGCIQVAPGRRTLPRPGCHALAVLSTAAANGANLLCSVHQRCRRDVIGIGKSGFLARYGTHTHTLVDAETAGLDNAFLQAPALAASALEIQVGIINLAHVHECQRLAQIGASQARRAQQQRFSQRQALAETCDSGPEQVLRR